jgi:hypothetical protein
MNASSNNSSGQKRGVLLTTLEMLYSIYDVLAGLTLEK